MIVVDTNILAAFCVPSSLSSTAEQVWKIDPDWQAPSLWASEFKSVILQNVRKGHVPAASSMTLMRKARLCVPSLNTHIPDDERVLDLAFKSGCSPYDCEFVAIAEALNVPFVTWDKLVLRQFPNVTVPPEAFVAYHRSKE
ncbi:MAG TPA: type II toxin-antitoxin system VapC family toxin [bacterium]|nr:type II toxin-antitoxin system VapC family toxin [bacterium]